MSLNSQWLQKYKPPNLKKQKTNLNSLPKPRMTQELDMTAPAKIFKSETRRDIKVIETSFVHL